MKKILLSLSAAMMLGLSAMAGQWCLLTDGGVYVPMSQVEMLVAADGATTFSVIRSSENGGNIDGVASVSFTFDDNSSIENIAGTDGELSLSGPAANSLTVMGCKDSSFSIIDASGRTVASGTLDSSCGNIDISGLDTGVHILIVGNKSLKFNKK